MVSQCCEHPAAVSSKCHVDFGFWEYSQDSLAPLEKAHSANAASSSSAAGQTSSQKMFAVLPHGTEALDSYSQAFWSLCFPTLFPYGDSVDGLYRRRKLPDWDWAKSMLTRVDRPRDHAWRLHKDFIAVLFSTMHRRHILRSVCLKVKSTGFHSTVSTPQFPFHS